MYTDAYSASKPFLLQGTFDQEYGLKKTQML